MEKSQTEKKTSFSNVTSDSSGGLKVDADLSDIKVIRRNGSVVSFEANKIAVAMTKAFLAVNGGQGAASARVREQTELFTSQIVEIFLRRLPAGGTLHIEEIQDQVELALMRAGEHEVARAYVLYRERRARERQKNDDKVKKDFSSELKISINGKLETLDAQFFLEIVNSACKGYEGLVNPNEILDAALKNIYDGIPFEEVFKSIVLSARTLIEKDPAYAKVSAQLLLYSIRKEVLGFDIQSSQIQKVYEEYFLRFIEKGIEKNLLDPELSKFDLIKLSSKIIAERDAQFDYLGIQTLYDRYFLVDRKDLVNKEGRRLELPQIFFMRVAMGLAIKEVDREARAIEFYDLLSSFDFMSSTPTLFNSGTQFSQLSSCYLSTVDDDLSGIYEAIKENALLAKYAGGLGNDWTPVRALGSYIKGTNGQSQGVVPFLKVVNDTAVAVNQGGKRKGAVCTYLETWHLDIEEFLELRKNTGDDRRRTHDMNTANWIPDLFMKRVNDQGKWTLFSPDTVPDLHEKVGKEFEVAYLNYEKQAEQGQLSPFKEVSSIVLWRKMLSMLYETGHPWITFKDPCNIRNPQQHKGIVHSSNLCTEITLNTSESEIAVCNLGSVNLVNHLIEVSKDKYQLDNHRLEKTINTAMRMLDNVIDINFYAVGKARNSNFRHRPVGLGIMGFQDSLHAMKIPYASNEAVEFADKSMETICYMAYSASSNLALERGSYSSFKGSLWEQGILPIDSLKLLEEHRGQKIEVDRSMTLDWDSLRKRIMKNGIRNSNCVAVAPTATISNIVGVSASIEPTFQNLYVKSNLSGEFTIVSETMVRDLKKLGLWDAVMVSDLKYFDGSLAKIDRIPAEIRNIYATAFEVDPKWIVECAARRQKWIDQSQSLNIYLSGVSGKKLDEIYKLAWKKGLKTTYYLRTLGATHAEKSTSNSSELNSVEVNEKTTTALCAIDDPECEACQ
ncbi:MAG: ribonucleoside-diphosphate reductase subunit alpha [Betaproteobacteria bacterium TMED156]|nr:MAG: ribonucleoside-diphosphate reductase subunit alpha [Betaproteobacteria bacterium TMED156]